MKVAVCMSGLVRTFRSCYQSYLDNIINFYDCDVFAFVSKPANMDDLRLLKFTAKQIVDPDPVLDEHDYSKFKDRRTRHYTTQGWLQQFWKVKMCNDMMLDHQQKTGVRYDWVIRCRPDLQITRKIDDLNTLDKRFIYTPVWPPSFEKEVPNCYDKDYIYDYAGNKGNMPDQLAIGSVELMTLYAQRHENLYNIVHSGEPWPLCAERSLTKHLQSCNVPVKFLRPMTALQRRQKK